MSMQLGTHDIVNKLNGKKCKNPGENDRILILLFDSFATKAKFGQIWMDLSLWAICFSLNYPISMQHQASNHTGLCLMV